MTLSLEEIVVNEKELAAEKDTFLMTWLIVPKTRFLHHTFG